MTANIGANTGAGMTVQRVASVKRCVRTMCKTQFERGSGVETFVYRIADGRALLAGYHINSNALISN